MTLQPHRNDPCPCGSGKKYKNCHLREDQTAGAPPLAEDHDGAVELAVAWLVERHRKGFKTTFEKVRDDVLPADDPQALARIARADDRIMEMLQINLTEWLLAEGEILVRGERRRVVEVLIGPDGPRLTEGQRRWLAQAGDRPLRLYTVTDVQVGEGVTLCDALDADALPRVVRERMGSRSMRAGMLMGCRVMQLPGHHELTGALYPFTALAAPGVMQAVREAASGAQPGNPRRLAGLTIMRAWFSQFVQPPAMPQLVDAQSGEPLLLVTDHYRVADSAALAQALAACGDVAGDATSGWRREFEGKDQLMRASAAINPGKQADRIEVFYRTQRLADDGRVWFDAVAGAAVQFLTREISDPRGVLAKGMPGAPAAASTTSLPPGVLADAIEKMLLRSYADWPDEPIPALDGKTPRQAIRSAAGLERVKGLLRSYEDGEADMAGREGRRAISYQFLWDALQIAR